MFNNDLREELYKGTNDTSKRTVSSVVNCGCTLPSNVFFFGGDCDCNFYTKNGCFHQFDIWSIACT